MWQLVHLEDTSSRADQNSSELSLTDRIRTLQAVDRGSPHWLLEQLAQNPNPTIRQNVASNFTCPTATLELLAQDLDLQVREQVASNRRCPPPVLAQLSLSRDTSTAKIAAQNPNTPAAARGAWALGLQHYLLH
jgi:hypothetical protein